MHIQKTILSDIKTANLKIQNHKLNRAVKAILFNMVEQGLGGQVQGDKGKARATNLPALDRETDHTEQGMWAVIMTKELWKKGVWSVFIPSSLFRSLSNTEQGRTRNLCQSLPRAAFIQ